MSVTTYHIKRLHSLCCFFGHFNPTVFLFWTLKHAPSNSFTFLDDVTVLGRSPILHICTGRDSLRFTFCIAKKFGQEVELCFFFASCTCLQHNGVHYEYSTATWVVMYIISQRLPFQKTCKDLLGWIVFFKTCTKKQVFLGLWIWYSS